MAQVNFVTIEVSRRAILVEIECVIGYHKSNLTFRVEWETKRAAHPARRAAFSSLIE
jgi:hypothetical protein